MLSQPFCVALTAALFHLCLSSAAADWQADTHSSSTVNAHNDTWTISGPNNVHAFIQSEVPEAPAIRVSASIKAPDAAELSPSIFLYWKPDTWLRIGYIAGNDIYHVHGPGVYGIVCENGKETRYRLTTTKSADWIYIPDSGNLHPSATDTRWNNIALMMTPDELYFQLASDNGEWESYQKITRSAPFDQRPTKIIVGKGYYVAGTHTAAYLKNDLAVGDAETTAIIKSLSVESVLESAQVAATKPGEYYQDIYGQAELAKPGDPTFESVASYWPPLLYPRDALSVPSHADEFVVLPDGQFAMWPAQETFPAPGKGSKCWVTVGEDKQRFGGGTTVTRSLQDNWLPILTCTYRHNGLAYKQTFAAWSKAMSPDEDLFGLLKLEVTNETTVSATARIGLFGENEKDELLAWENLKLQPAESRYYFAQIPFPAEGSKLSVPKIEADDFDQKIIEVRSAWQSIIDHGTQITIPEQRIMDAWKAWLVWIYTGVDKIKGHYEFHDGAGGFYELVYGISAARGSQIFDLLNRTEDSRKWINAMLSMVSDDGLFLVNSGLPDQGALMQSVYSHFRATRDTEWLKRVAPTLQKMTHWSLANRKTASSQTPTTSPVHGMIKARPYCDHAQPEYYIISDIYLANGMKYLAETFEHIGLTTESEALRTEADKYTRDIQQVLAKSVFEVDGFKLLPLFPETRELLRASGWMGSNYYSILSPSLLESGGDALPPNSVYANMIVETLEKRGGLLMGLCRFWGGIDHAYTAGYWYHRLINGEPEKALLGLYGSLAYAMSRDTFSSVEVTFAKDGKNFPTLPHNYSNQEQLRLVRNLLVTETTDTLMLGAGISRHWIATGKPVGITNAGTPWGDVSYTILFKDDKTIQVDLESPSQNPPGGIKVFFRHPDSQPMKDVKVTGADIINRSDESVTIISKSHGVSVTAVY